MQPSKLLEIHMANSYESTFPMNQPEDLMATSFPMCISL